MSNSRKQELQNFISYLTANSFLGVYYLDKQMGILHYTIYPYEKLNDFNEKLKNLNAQLDDDLIQVVLWKSSESADYLVGVYDGLVKEQILVETVK